ncbi:MAG: hypothetical protein JXP73_03250 [Deltaproteobacteria bacterium]|nr:hypothetical protein [Deltaproteobacteria bacterium]
MMEWNPRRLTEAERPTSRFRRPSDKQMAGCIATLATVIGAEAAASPSWQRRLAIADQTGELLVLLDVPTRWISPGDGAHGVAPEPGPRLDEWLATHSLGFPVDTAIRLLDSAESPEREIERRRAILRRRDELRAERAAEVAAKQAAEAAALAAQAERETRFRESAWSKLEPGQRLLLTVSLAVEADNPDLATVLRDGAGLQGGFLALPRTQWWLPKDKRTDR